MPEYPRSVRRLALKAPLKTYFARAERKARGKRVPGASPESRKAIFRKREDFVRPTASVTRYATKFHKNIEGVGKLVEDISRIELVWEKPDVAKSLYAKQTGEDVIVSRKIPAVYKSSQPSFGCAALCTALNAALNAMEIENKHVRTITDIGTPHSVVWFRLGGREFIADPFMEGRFFLGTKMHEVDGNLKKKIGRLQRSGLWKEGRSLQELGIREYGDYIREAKA